MKSFRLLLYSLFSLIFIFPACIQKEAIFEDEHVLEEVEDNDPPPYNGVTTVQLRSYINKIYIDLLGREPLDNEMASAEADLRQGELSDSSIEDLVSGLLSSSEYYDRFLDIYNAAMLNSTTAGEIALTIDAFQYQITLTQDPLEQLYFQREIDKLNALLDAPDNYRNGIISVSDLMAIISNNFYYDQINMGTENFVISCFENLFKRYPTDSELESAITMVDGFPAQLLLQDGASKEQFLVIMTSNPEFYQGITIDIYRQLLARDPDSVEMGLGTEVLDSGQMDYQELQLEVIKTEEYKGF